MITHIYYFIHMKTFLPCLCSGKLTYRNKLYIIHHLIAPLFILAGLVLFWSTFPASMHPLPSGFFPSRSVPKATSLWNCLRTYTPTVRPIAPEWKKGVGWVREVKGDSSWRGESFSSWGIFHWMEFSGLRFRRSSCCYLFTKVYKTSSHLPGINLA